MDLSLIISVASLFISLISVVIVFISFKKSLESNSPNFELIIEEYDKSSEYSVLKIIKENLVEEGTISFQGEFFEKDGYFILAFDTKKILRTLDKSKYLELTVNLTNGNLICYKMFPRDSNWKRIGEKEGIFKGDIFEIRDKKIKFLTL